MRVEVSAYASVSLASFAFQACAFNHSDISPFRINNLREIVWSRSGRELFYRNGSQMMSVPIEATSEFRRGKAVQLFEGPFLACCPGLPEYDVSLDGRRFIMLTEKQLVPTHLNVVLNWKATVPSLAK